MNMKACGIHRTKRGNDHAGCGSRFGRPSIHAGIYLVGHHDSYDLQQRCKFDDENWFDMMCVYDGHNFDGSRPIVRTWQQVAYFCFNIRHDYIMNCENVGGWAYMYSYDVCVVKVASWDIDSTCLQNGTSNGGICLSQQLCKDACRLRWHFRDLT